MSTTEARPAASPHPARTGAAAVRAALDAATVARLVRLVAAPPGAETVATTAPFTGLPLAEVPQSTPDDVAAAFDAARAAQKAWARRPLADRAAVLLRWHDLVLARQDEVLDLVQLESGKARLHAFEEVADVAVVARHYARVAPHLLRPRRRRGLFPGLTRVDEMRHPQGVVGIVSPWNYPLTLGISDALPALLAGNAVVAKPDTQTALTALWAVELLHEAGLPDGLVQVVVGDGPVVGTAVVEHGDHVCFTGSTRTGRVVAQQAAARLVGASLELGGKNPMLVLHDADLDRAAEGAVRGCFSSAGQLCVSAERLLVDARVHDAFLDRFLARVRAMRLSAALDFGADMGSLVGPRQLATVTAHVEDARAKGAQVLAGGRPRPDLGPYFYEPTVLADVTPDMVCHDEETFGPVVAVSTFATEDEAVARANATPYGLNASVWTRDAGRGRALAARLHVGTVNVNEGYAAAWGSVAAPMGGRKDSGVGRRHGEEGLLRFTEVQTVATARLLGLGTPPRLTEEQWARALTTALRALKAVGAR